MDNNSIWMIWPGQPALSALVWAAVLVVLLYLARGLAHQAIRALGSTVHRAMRIAGRSLMLAQARLGQRNREVLLAEGRERTERLIEREFRRIEDAAKKSLEAYPTLNRRLLEQISAIDEDYRKSADVPPAVPGWVEAVEAIAKLKAGSDPMIVEVLGDIHGSLEKACDRAIGEYRGASKMRHGLLRRMLPYWKGLSRKLEDVDKTFTRLLERARTIDHQMEAYKAICAGNDQAVRTLSASSFAQFIIATFVLAIATGGALINFHLIAYPLQEMVGGTAYIAGMKVSDVAGLVVIFLEIAVGLFLMDSLRITRLFPLIHSLDDRLRHWMIWVAFTLLVILAAVESSLAFMRDIIAADAEALRQSLAGPDVAAASMGDRWIATVGQMTMGFILPFVLMFVAIPLESFIHSARTVVGAGAVALLRLLAALLRLIGNLFLNGCGMLVRLYDLLVFAPLWIEQRVRPAPAANGGVPPPARKPAVEVRP